MTETSNGAPADADPSNEKSERRGRRWPTAIILAATVVADALIFTMVVPWAEGISKDRFMSLGYVVTFLTVFVNLLIVLGLVAYMFHGDSYPSDRWK